VGLAFAKLREAAFTSLLVPPAPILDARALQVGRFAAEHRLIAMMPWKEYVHAGGLVSYGADLAALWRRAVTYVDRILRGAAPGELPIEQPTKFELVINMKTARAIGLTLPPGLLLRADQVLE
jgi:putative ABC transport system substrate-binding protein